MKKKGIIITLLTIAIILILVTFSYAYWRLTYTATKVNKIITFDNGETIDFDCKYKDE